MSAILAAKDICDRALRMIGAFPVTESAPDGEHMREAMFWLDLVLGELSGVVPLLFQQPEPTGFVLTPGTQEYLLPTAMGEAYPTDGIQFPRAAWLEDEAGRRHEVTIVSRSTWTAKENPDQTGVPCEVYIDRLLDGPTLYTWPTLPEDAEEEWTLYLDVQTFSPTVAPSGVTGSRPLGSITTNVPTAWQRFAIYRLAMDIGSGPVAKIGEGSLDRFEKQAAIARRELEAVQNRHHDTEPPIAAAYWLD